MSRASARARAILRLVTQVAGLPLRLRSCEPVRMAHASWTARVVRVQDYIRRHLDGDLRLGTLADLVGASRFHFARVYKGVTGETLTHFVQRARLERAAVLMQSEPQRKLLDVALEVGLGSAANFARVFRQHFGVAPSAWDRKSTLQVAIPNYEDFLAEAREHCPPFEPIVREHPAVRIAYVRVATPFMDREILDAGYRELCAWFDARGVDWREFSLLGMSWDHPEVTPLDQVRYDLGFALPPGLHADGELGERALPAMRSVEVGVCGGLAFIALAWEFLNERWLPERPHEPADLPAMKRFHRSPALEGWREFDLDCCIALR